MDEELKQFIIKLYNSNNFEYDESKDLYSNYASQLFNLPYEDCLEYKNNRPYPEGQSRRLHIKEALLFMFYRGNFE